MQCINQQSLLWIPARVEIGTRHVAAPCCLKKHIATKKKSLGNTCYLFLGVYQKKVLLTCNYTNKNVRSSTQSADRLAG